jgi:hypothetical protein
VVALAGVGNAGEGFATPGAINEEFLKQVHAPESGRGGIEKPNEVNHL